jgi:hypothetical protein
MDRRESLVAIAGVAASLAGCSALSGDDGSTRTATVTERPPPDDSDPGRGSDPGETPETLLVRADTDLQPVWLADPDREDGGRPTPRRDEHRLDTVVVDSASRADRISVGDGVDRDRAAPFLSATDFGSEAVYVETFRVEECFRLVLCDVSWSSDRISTDYGRETRPWDEACSADERVYESRLIRIPEALDADDVNSYSASVGAGSCGQRVGRAVAAGEGGTGTESPTATPTSTPTDTDAGGEQ